jgi:CSLREA domain-containing protein
MGRTESSTGSTGSIRQVLSPFKTTLHVTVLATVLLLMGNVPALASPPYIVNTTSDHDDGDCAQPSDLPPGDCTLREAIRETNATVNVHDTITFNIVFVVLPGEYNGSWWTIRLLTDLPPLTDPAGTTIDGGSSWGTPISSEQPGVLPNTCGVLSFPKPRIAIDGNLLALDAMTIAAGSSNNRIMRMAIYNATFHAILGEPGAGTPLLPNVIDQMFIGVLPDGSDPGPAERNKEFGIQQQGLVPSYMTVKRSYVGYNGMGGIDGERDLSELTIEKNEVFQNGWASDSHDGIDINGRNSEARCNFSHDNTSAFANGGGGNGIEVGSVTPGPDLDNNVVEFNTFTYNLSAGISIRKGARGNLVQKNVSAHNVSGISVNVEKTVAPDGLVIGGAPTNRNGIYKNSTYLNMIPPTGTGIDLQNESADQTSWLMMPDGQNATPLTGQDNCDPDRGAPDGEAGNVTSNDLQNRPILEFADLFNGQVRIRGTLDSTPNLDYLIQFFATPSGEASGLEGKTFIGEIVVSTTGCLATFETPFFAPAEAVQDGDLITATATKYTGPVNTSNEDDWWSTSEYSGSVPLNNFLPVGKVTGGGYIQPTTLVACATPCVNASDKRANYGFVAQYKNHTDGDPQGHINFVWNPGKLHFSSTDYLFLSLIVTRDPDTGNGKAKWQGEGKLNNKPGYCFKANVTDNGEPAQTGNPLTTDSFRIKIWKKTDANCSVEGAPIYDNGSDVAETPVSGGNIQIHHP